MKSRYGLEIRAATAAEAPGLAALLESVGRPVSARDLAERLEALGHEAGTVLVALEWGPPSGVVVLHWYRTLEAAQRTAAITALLVGPDARRRGIGRLLIKAAAQAARVAGCDALEVRVAPGDEDLRGFCLATGFAEVGASFSRGLRKKG